MCTWFRWVYSQEHNRINWPCIYNCYQYILAHHQPLLHSLPLLSFNTDTRPPHLPTDGAIRVLSETQKSDVTYLLTFPRSFPDTCSVTFEHDIQSSSVWFWPSAFSKCWPHVIPWLYKLGLSTRYSLSFTFHMLPSHQANPSSFRQFIFLSTGHFPSPSLWCQPYAHFHPLALQPDSSPDHSSESRDDQFIHGCNPCNILGTQSMFIKHSLNPNTLMKTGNSTLDSQTLKTRGDLSTHLKDHLL